jgi:predicted restriction endonuclease
MYAVYNIRCVICIECNSKYNTIIRAKYVKDALQFISSPISNKIDKIL